MQAPRCLKQGNKVGIISTARKISEQEIQPAIDLLEKWGLQVVKGKHLHAVDNQFAGTVNQRVSDLQMMINDPDIMAVFCARGGYGTVQVVDQIDWWSFRVHPKWIVGYSDITVLHSHIQRNLGIESIHATMPINFPKDFEDTATQALHEALFNDKVHYSFPSHPLNKPGIVQAPMVGGNLSILYSLIGSPSDINPANNILFLEDLDEYLYHIDRMITNMRRNDKFKHLSGLVIGGMTDMKDNAVPFGMDAYEIIHHIFQDCHFPICFGFPAGHIKDNRAIIIGRDAVLKIEKDITTFSQF
jgi:muramoyltetrapeptide carboxypeptidase